MTEEFDYEPNEHEITLTHYPVVPCRPSVFGEGIYVECWQRFLAADFDEKEYPNDRFISIFYLGRAITPKDATDAAAFICWLGTNCGRSFIHKAEQIYSKLNDRESAYALAWSEQNVRHAYINGGIRTLEAIIKDPTVSTIEVFESCARWLGTADGQELIREAEAEILETRKFLENKNSMRARAAQRASEIMRTENLP